MMKFAERMRLFLLFSRKRSSNLGTFHPDPTLCFCGHPRAAHRGDRADLIPGGPRIRARCRRCECPAYAEAKEES